MAVALSVKIQLVISVTLGSGLKKLTFQSSQSTIAWRLEARFPDLLMTAIKHTYGLLLKPNDNLA